MLLQLNVGEAGRQQFQALLSSGVGYPIKIPPSLITMLFRECVGEEITMELVGGAAPTIWSHTIPVHIIYWCGSIADTLVHFFPGVCQIVGTALLKKTLSLSGYERYVKLAPPPLPNFSPINSSLFLYYSSQTSL